MKLDDKIYVAGHTGLVGSSIIRSLLKRNFSNIITRTRKELNLLNQTEVNNFFAKEKPSYVIIAAAKVGGIYANNAYPAEFIYQNLMIEANIIHASYKNSVTRLLFLGSTCIYPKETPQPMSEAALLTSSLEPTNEPYAIAKIAGIKLCESYNRQYGIDFRSVMPTNLYGINDNFDSKNSHVIPALISRFHQAKMVNDSEVEVWGSGLIKRDFLFVDDMVNASIFILELDKKVYLKNTQPMLSHINIGSGSDITIRELAEIIKKVVDYKGKIKFNSNKPDGTNRKLVDISRIKRMGWTPSIGLEHGIKETYNWYRNHAKH